MLPPHYETMLDEDVVRFGIKADMVPDTKVSSPVNRWMNEEVERIGQDDCPQKPMHVYFETHGSEKVIKRWRQGVDNTADIQSNFIRRLTTDITII